jgi:leucyl aminopeptidase
MLFSTADQLGKRKDADLIVFPFWQAQKKKRHAKPKPAAFIGSFSSFAKPALESGDFEGSVCETLLLYVKGSKEKRCLLLGLGKEEDLTAEVLRRAYSNVAKECQRKALSNINLVVPTISELRTVSAEECLKGIAEGLLLTNYRWEKLASLDEETVLLDSVCLIGVLPNLLGCVKECEHIAEGIYLARDLINGNADIVTPHYLAETKRSKKRRWAYFWQSREALQLNLPLFY